jgi:CDK inhibitor PHO81
MARHMFVADHDSDPVLLCNDLGTKRDPRHPGAVVRSNGHASISVKEAVRIAQSNNFMGLMCNARLLV